MVECPAPCGEHFVFYPGMLVEAERRDEFYTFATSCECVDKAYLAHTESDGAHAKAEGSVTAISKVYEELPDEEFLVEDEDDLSLQTHRCSSLSQSNLRAIAGPAWPGRAALPLGAEVLGFPGLPTIRPQAAPQH